MGAVRQNGVAYPQKLFTPGRLRLSVWGCWWACSLRVLCAILPKWFLPTRLETRTKESNIYASVLVEKPTRVINVIDAKRKQQHRPTMSLRVKV
jgi:hypothetical protein